MPRSKTYDYRCVLSNNHNLLSLQSDQNKPCGYVRLWLGSARIYYPEGSDRMRKQPAELPYKQISPEGEEARRCPVQCNSCFSVV